MRMKCTISLFGINFVTVYMVLRAKRILLRPRKLVLFLRTSDSDVQTNPTNSLRGNSKIDNLHDFIASPNGARRWRK